MNKDQLLNMVKMMRAEDAAAAKRAKQIGRRITFSRPDGSEAYALAYGPDTNETLPTLIDICGGGFVTGMPELDDTFCAKITHDLNIRVFSVDYRWAPEYPYPQDKRDVLYAAEWLIENKDKLGIDINHLGIAGHSAGGNIATCVCLMAKQQGLSPFACQLLDYPVCDTATSAQDKPSVVGCIPAEISDMFDSLYREPDQAKEPLCSPLYASEDELRGLPPAIIVTADSDALKFEAHDYAQHLVAAGVPVMYKNFEGVGHGFTIDTYGSMVPPECPHDPAVQEAALAFMEEGLRTYLLKP